MAPGIIEALTVVRAASTLIGGIMDAVKQAGEEGRDLTREEMESIKTQRDATNESFEAELERRREAEATTAVEPVATEEPPPVDQPEPGV